MPISLAAGRVRTPEFPVKKHSQWYDIMLQFEKPLPFRQMKCMVGATSGRPDKQDCEKDDPVVRADWTVWEGGRIVEWGSIPNYLVPYSRTRTSSSRSAVSHWKWARSYVVQVHFTNDGSPLNAANPHLIVIPHGTCGKGPLDMFSQSRIAPRPIFIPGPPRMYTGALLAGLRPGLLRVRSRAPREQASRNAGSRRRKLIAKN